MIAALLPLPPNPMAEMRERDAENSTSNLDSSNDFSNDFIRQFGPTDEIRFESAKWWRNLNRWMSLVGLLIIAAVVLIFVLLCKTKLTDFAGCLGSDRPKRRLGQELNPRFISIHATASSHDDFIRF